MTNPYEVLGVSPSSTDEDVKKAYRELAKKYHPDNYPSSPLKEVAEEKMAEVNQAFDSIMNERKLRAKPGASSSSNGNGTWQGSGQQTTDYQYQTNSSYANSSFHDIRAMIQQNRLAEAEELLDGVPESRRDGEWHFLKGSIYFSRGWLEDAMNQFSTACRMSPNNPEYRAAMNRLMWQRQGNFGTGAGNNPNPYRTTQNTGGCSACDMCSGLICADCCCECMGGDLISCC